MTQRYKIVRFYFNTSSRRVVKRGLTLEEAKVHCNDPETSSSTAKGRSAKQRTKTLGPWFDGFTKE